MNDQNETTEEGEVSKSSALPVPTPEKQQVNFTTFAILIGFALVAGAIFMTGSNGTTAPTAARNVPTPIDRGVDADISPQRLEGVQNFVYGNPEAATTIVEFSDYECPFCSRLHPTLEKIVDESEGEINWEFRHLPLPSHKNAELAAVIGECVGTTAGNDAFWEYTSTLFENQRSIKNEFLTKTALSFGMEPSALEACVNGGDAASQVAADLATARALGGSGTPFNVVVFADGTKQAVSGALPYENWVKILGL